MDQRSCKINAVKESLNKILAFLTMYLPLANAHMSAFLTDSQWELLIPEKIREELTLFTDEELKNLAELGYHSNEKPQNCKQTARIEAKNKEVVVCNEALDGIGECKVNDDKSLIGLKTGCVTKKFKEYNRTENNEMVSYTSCSCAEKADTSWNTAGDNKENDNQTKRTHLKSNHDSLILSGRDAKSLEWNHRSIIHFCRDAWSNTIEGKSLAVTVEELFDQLDLTLNDKNAFVPSFMNEKKSHEVAIMSEVCSQLSKILGCKLVSTILHIIRGVQQYQYTAVFLWHDTYRCTLACLYCSILVILLLATVYNKWFVPMYFIHGYIIIKYWLSSV